MLVEVYLRLADVLSLDPQRHLIPTTDDHGGMLFYFDMVDRFIWKLPNGH